MCRVPHDTAYTSRSNAPKTIAGEEASPWLLPGSGGPCAAPMPRPHAKSVPAPLPPAKTAARAASPKPHGNELARGPSSSAAERGDLPRRRAVSSGTSGAAALLLLAPQPMLPLAAWPVSAPSAATCEARRSRWPLACAVATLAPMSRVSAAEATPPRVKSRTATPGSSARRPVSQVSSSSSDLHTRSSVLYCALPRAPLASLVR
mmetsp:Transcript_22046/g.68178  ORF Transcript_22046/g.68178 Transcript_22046/m.68178 type:complete len:205 (-) Transcript_22046:304-918(-)